MKKFSVLIIIFLLTGITANSQVIPNPQHTTGQLSNPSKFWIYFTDKNNSPYSLSNPSDYLSEASIERRRRQHIPIRLLDIPVNKNYVEGIKNTGARIIVESRWMNAVSVIATDEQLALISEQPFVKQIEPVRCMHIPFDEQEPENNNSFYRLTDIENSDYGGSDNQIKMLHVDFLHDLGYTGEGLRIAVLDAGFSGVDTGVGFQSFWEKGQILETRNFPDDNDSVFFSSSHGSNVLSIMGADVPGTYIGAAPDAKFYLFRTEIADSERVVEEDYWLEAAEYADFIGAQMINSSLGYTTFDEPSENHSYADMDGNTTVITNAADWAASVGILVCSSAGNEGNEPWKYISAPADGDSVFTIGSVNNIEQPSGFSSWGPTSDGRLKPNVVCQGEGARVLDKSGYVYEGSGTSYSSPLMTGACASFWQAFPDFNNMQIIDAVQKSADHYFNPDNKVGYGIPDFSIAYELLQTNNSENELLTIYPNPAGDHAIIQISANEIGPATLDMYDAAGKFLRSYSIELHQGEQTRFVLTGISQLASGIYLLNLKTPDNGETRLLFVK